MTEPSPRRRWPAITVGAAVIAVAAGVAVAVLQGAGHTTSGTAVAAPTPTPTVPATPVKRPAKISPTERQVRRMIVANATLRQGSPKHRYVALTFDDGPGPYTAQVVRELRQLHAPATFFEVGEMIKGYPTLVRNMAKWGFPIEDHTWSHPFLPGISHTAVEDQLLWTRNKIYKATGVYPQFFRPPYGSQTARIRRIGGSLGMVSTLWSIDTRDWSRPGTSAIIYAAEQVRPGGIILMHDGGGIRSQTVAAVPTIVRYLRHRGFTLVTIPQLLTLAPPAHPSGAGLSLARTGA